ncbi:sialate O-acetylesterase [Marinimicrobium sp. ABcell2]|uniref:sialate O-acetylesterase n=1 Tax=Marinimicrobium sp. ABcell2 TaxID=3069751 RepID=UPI0027AED680|nr:sialate O-acetylesterase [Marinimicrobium sp. ABcell2]MDQ2077055.1 sialate O-acetylesterase [Marinimicrobium sp. ABcell2]
MKDFWCRVALSACLFAVSLSAWAEVSVPRLVSDGMVLQRDSELDLWGWADAGEQIQIAFRGAVYETEANAEGKWQVQLPPMPAGGPHKLEVSGPNRIVVRDVLVGDVWLASGQSNMQLTMRRTEPLYGRLMAEAQNDHIREFTVPERYDFNEPQQDLEGGHWRAVAPDTIKDFSAVAYFFARRLQENQGVPIGIINASLGGSPVEAWLSEEALKAFPEHLEEAKRYRDADFERQVIEADQARSQAWHQEMDERDRGLDKGEPRWLGADVDLAQWQTMSVPGYWATEDGEAVNGALWFRKSFHVPLNMAGQPAELNLGKIIDSDTAYVNGVQVGSTGYRYPPRWYHVPAGVLQAGENTLVLRVVSQGGRGGFVPDRLYELDFGRTRVDLTGDWHYRVGAAMPPLAPQTFVRWKPLGLFNGMIAPLVNYRINGVIWYQGESNVGRADEYRDSFASLIGDWRHQWLQGDFPFVYAQLSNYLERAEEPSPSGWAQLREAQLHTLRVPGTAMAVTVDVGEWNDIHPLNKMAVGERLAAGAQALAYGSQEVHSGPLYKDLTVKRRKVVLSFDHTGSGLALSIGDEPRGFAIAGEDREFVWAEARIKGDTIEVWSDQVRKPVAVRYGWADNPEVNLTNKEGFPASPFRTDDWPE